MLVMLDTFRQSEWPMAPVCWSRGQNLSKSYMFAERCHRARANHCFNDHHLSPRKVGPSTGFNPSSFHNWHPKLSEVLFSTNLLVVPSSKYVDEPIDPIYNPINYIYIYIYIYLLSWLNYHILSWCFFGVSTIVQLCDLEHLANFY